MSEVSGEGVEIPGMDVASVQLLVPPMRDVQRRAARAAGGGVTILDPPHVSLGYPWRAVPTADVMARVSARHPPIHARLVGPRRFGPDRQGRVVVYLAVEDPSPVTALAAALGWRGDTLLPHCSVVRTAESDRARRAEQVVADAAPLDVVLDEIDVQVRVDGTWQPLRRARLTAAS